MRTSKGRHGGGGGRTDKGEAANQRAQARRNTDVDSLTRSRNDNRGHEAARVPLCAIAERLPASRSCENILDGANADESSQWKAHPSQ